MTTINVQEQLFDTLNAIMLLSAQMSDIIHHETAPYFTVEEVAAIFRVQQNTIRTWIRTERIKAIRTSGGWRVSGDSVKEFERRLAEIPVIPLKPRKPSIKKPKEPNKTPAKTHERTLDREPLDHA